MFKYLSLKEAEKALKIRNLILVSLDLELHEVDLHHIIEYGMSVFSRRYQESISDSFPIPMSIFPYHMIPQSHFHKRNGRYVPDHKFEFNFDKSLIMEESVCKKVVEDTLRLALKNGEVILVGHGVKTDLSALQKAGIDLPSIEPTWKVLDTEILWRECTEAKFSSLERVLKYLRIPHRNLHNGGNDAFYTLQLAFFLTSKRFRASHNLSTVEPKQRATKMLRQRLRPMNDRIENSDRVKKGSPDDVLSPLMKAFTSKAESDAN